MTAATFLSPWQQYAVPGIGTGARPALFGAYAVTGSQADNSNYSATARVPVIVQNPPAALLADYRYPQVPAYPYTLADYQQGILSALSGWRESWTVTAAGFTLLADSMSQANFTSLATLHQVAQAAGAETSASSTWIVDASGKQQTMTVGALMTLLLSYGQQVQTLQGTYYTAMAAVQAAQTTAALDAIALPPGTA